MTSDFARNRGLSEQTRESYRRYGVSPRSVDDRLHFYLTYLQDVAPWGLTINHFPGNRFTTREEIQLLTSSGRIFMSGLVSVERSAAMIETIAGNEAYTKWLDGYFMPYDQNWRFFTGLTQIRLFNSHRGDEWDHVGDFHPIVQAQEVAAFLQQEYDRLEFH